jgi:hypothetical protein
MQGCMVFLGPEVLNDMGACTGQSPPTMSCLPDGMCSTAFSILGPSIIIDNASAGGVP